MLPDEIGNYPENNDPTRSSRGELSTRTYRKPGARNSPKWVESVSRRPAISWRSTLALLFYRPDIVQPCARIPVGFDITTSSALLYTRSHPRRA